MGVSYVPSWADRGIYVLWLAAALANQNWEKSVCGLMQFLFGMSFARALSILKAVCAWDLLVLRQGTGQEEEGEAYSGGEGEGH